MVVHPEVEVTHDYYRSLQPFGQIKGVGSKRKALFWIAGKEQDMFGVTVGGIGTGEQIGLLRSGWHSG